MKAKLSLYLFNIPPEPSHVLFHVISGQTANERGSIPIRMPPSILRFEEFFMQGNVSKPGCPLPQSGLVLFYVTGGRKPGNKFPVFVKNVHAI